MSYERMLDAIKKQFKQQRAKNEIRKAKTQNSLTKPNFWKRNEHKTDYNIKLTDYLRDAEI